ncbi:MAG: hypothetical protein FJ299_11625 [Planctomycetes bacterium]|nr:hypothetical protein [Planctomycetota bacterium]
MRKGLLPIACAAALAVAALNRPDPPVAFGSSEPTWLTGPDEIALEPHACFDAAGRLWIAWIRFQSGTAMSGPYLECAWLEDGAPRGRARIPLELVAPAEPRLAPHGDGVCLVVEGERAAEPRSIWAIDLDARVDTLVTGAPRRLSRGSAPALDPDLARLSDGTLLCAWRAPSGASHDIFLSARQGDAWTEPSSAATPLDEWHPRLAADANGGAILAYDAWDGRSFDVWARRVDAAGCGPPIAVAVGPAHAAQPELAGAADGGVWIAWEESDSFGDFGPLRASREFALARLDGPAAASAQRAEWSVPAAARLASGHPRIACNGDRPVLTARVLDTEVRDAAFSKSGAQAAFYASWRTRVWQPGSTGEPMDLAFDGGADGSETLLADPRGGWVVVALGDGRSTRVLATQPFEDAVEGNWCVGIARLPASGEQRELVLRAPASAPESAPIESVAQAAAEWRAPGGVFFGDLHRHTHQSRCSTQSDGTREDAYRYARGPGRLDFIAITDHHQHLTECSWWLARRDALRHDDPGRLAVFAGLERVLVGRGHFNEVFLDAREAEWAPERFERLGSGLPAKRAARSILIPHMLGLRQNHVRWEAVDGALVRLAEVYQGARGSFEDVGAPLQSSENTRKRAALDAAFATGIDLGLIGSSDHNAVHGGLAGVLAERAGRAELFSALQARATFASIGHCAVDLRIGALRMGQSGGAEPDAMLELSARGPSEVACVELLRDGALLRRWSGAERADGASRELYVVTLQHAFGAPLELEPRGGRVAAARTRAAGDTGYRVELVDGDRLARVRLVSKGQQVCELALELEWNVPESDRLIALRMGGEPFELAVRALAPGASRNLQVERGEGRDVGLWRVGAPLGKAEFDAAIPLPGPGVYRARIAFRDGNLAWTSPIRIQPE